MSQKCMNLLLLLLTLDHCILLFNNNSSLIWIFKNDEYIAFRNVSHFSLNSIFNSFCKFCIKSNFSIKCNLINLYVWNTSFSLMLFKKLIQNWFLISFIASWYEFHICTIFAHALSLLHLFQICFFDNSVFHLLMSSLFHQSFDFAHIHCLNMNRLWTIIIDVIKRKKTKVNYLNYLKTEHIINMMLTLHSDHQKQMRSIIDVMLTSEQKMIIIILQKNSIKTKNIHKKLNKLQVLYEFNERRNNELMLWKEMRRLTKMIEKLTWQRIAALTVNQCMKNQLKRLKKIMSRLKKKFAKKKKHIDNWAKRANEKSTTSFENHLVLSVDVASSMQNHCKKFKIKIFVKEKKKIKRIMMITIKNIVKWAREIDVNEMLSTCKNIKIMKRWSNLLIFQVKTKDRKKILKKNNFWIKEILLNASLHEVSFKIVIHEIKVEEMFKDIEKKKAKALIKINKDIHLKMMIEKVKWLTKNSEQKRYILLMIHVVSVEMMNKLIDKKVCHKINIKITQFYDSSCRTHQCLKYQDYNYKTYECWNKQRCVYCTLNHRLKHCSHKQTWDMWKCEAC